MQITDSKLQLQLQVASTTDKLLQALQPGQTLRAVTLTPTSNSGALQLQIGRTEITAQSPIPLQAGVKLTLNVQKGGEKPQLQIVSPLSTQQKLQQAAMSALPRQQPLQPLFQNLSHLLSSGDPLPPPFRDLASQLMRSLLTSTEPALGQKLREAVSRSGPFLESQLLSGKPDKLDLKATMIKMIQQLRPLLESSGQMQNGKLLTPQTASTTPPSNTPPPNPLNKVPQPLSQTQPLTGDTPTRAHEPPRVPADISLKSPPETAPLLRPKAEHATTTPTTTTAPQPNPLLQQLIDLFKNLEGGLARIQLHQVATLQSDEGNKQVWQLDLPIRHHELTHSFEIHIEHEQPSPANHNGHIWNLNLSFDIQPLGPMHVHLMLKDGEQLSTLFWAQQQKTLSLVNDNLSQLQRNFERAGLKVERLDAFLGKPAEKPQPRWQTSLLSEKA